MLICKKCGCKIVQGAFELRTGIGTAKFCPCCGGELQKEEQPAVEQQNEKRSIQRIMIKRHLLQHGSITPMDALQKFGCMRLAARISELREEGMHIRTDRPDGDQYAIYRLIYDGSGEVQNA